jgi:hypothetical protein
MTFDPTASIDVTQADDDRDPTIVEGVQAVVAGERAEQRTCIPATVQSYDIATQRATVQAGVQLQLLDGTTISEPVFADVPVMWPSAGGYSFHAPLAAGDEVLVVFAERSIDEWLAAGGYNRVANDPRRFSAQDAIAIPGLRSAPNALPANARPAGAVCVAAADGAVRMEIRAGGVVTIFATEVRLGDDSAVALALANLVDARLSTIRTAYDAHTHVSAAPGVPTAPPVPLIGVLASTAATRAKGV